MTKPKRPQTLGGSHCVSVKLNPARMGKVETYQKKRGLPSLSEAIRTMIDVATAKPFGAS